MNVGRHRMLKIYQDTRAGGVCRSCGATVEHADLVSGRRIAFNGPIIAVLTQDDFVTRRVVQHVDTRVTLPHFATCPDTTGRKAR